MLERLVSDQEEEIRNLLKSLEHVTQLLRTTEKQSPKLTRITLAAVGEALEGINRSIIEVLRRR